MGRFSLVPRPSFKETTLIIPLQTSMHNLLKPSKTLQRLSFQQNPQQRLAHSVRCNYICQTFLPFLEEGLGTRLATVILSHTNNQCFSWKREWLINLLMIERHTIVRVTCTQARKEGRRKVLHYKWAIMVHVLNMAFQSINNVTIPTAYTSNQQTTSPNGNKPMIFFLVQLGTMVIMILSYERSISLHVQTQCIVPDTDSQVTCT